MVVTATSKIVASISAQITPTTGIVPFTVTIWGRLTEPTGGVLNGKTINLYNADGSGNPVGAPIASTITGVLGAGSPGGDYTFPVNITVAGTYRFVTEFPGDATYEGCEKVVGQAVGIGVGGKIGINSLRRSWIVVVGSNAPAAEVNNGTSVIQHIRRKLNLTPFKAFPDTFPGLPYLAKNCNVMTIGAPNANEWAFNLNEFTEPKYDITVNREKAADEAWKDYVTSGGIAVKGFIVGTVPVAGQDHRGLLATGQQVNSRLRPLQVMHIGGWAFEDTCTMVKAFLADVDPGFYQCDWPDPADPTMAACPASPTYTKLTV
jgi:hypothetical protein